MKKIFAGMAMIVCSSGALSPAVAQTSDAWQFGASLNVYLPTISGTTNFSGNGGGSGGASVDAGKILDSLKMTFMGTLDARKGQWGAFTDVLYLDLGNSKSVTSLSIGGAPLPVGASANASLDIKGTVWTLGGYYRAVARPSAEVQLLAGARMLDLREKLDWQLNGNVGSIPTAGHSGSSEVSDTFWDFVVGTKGRFGLGAENRWFVPYYLDVGTGQSKSTLQAMTGVGYSFGWGDVYAAWRYLDYKMKSGSSIQDVNLSGPQVSAVFRW